MAVLTLAGFITKSTLGETLAVHFETFAFGTMTSQICDCRGFLANNSELSIVDQSRLLLNSFLAKASCFLT